MVYSIKHELTHVCSLNGFQLVMGLYRDHPYFFFLKCVYLIYMYKQALALNNLYWFMCNKTQLKQI